MTELRFGRVQAVDNGRARVQMADDGMLTDLLPVLKARTKGVQVDYRLAVGEFVAVLLDCDGSTGVVLGAVNSDADPVGTNAPGVVQVRMPDGSLVTWNEQTGVLLVDAKGSVTLKAPTVTVQGSLQVMGNIQATGIVRGQDVQTANVSLNLHTHTSAAPGSPTTPPVPVPNPPLP